MESVIVSLGVLVMAVIVCAALVDGPAVWSDLRCAWSEARVRVKWWRVQREIRRMQREDDAAYRRWTREW